MASQERQDKAGAARASDADPHDKSADTQTGEGQTDEGAAPEWTHGLRQLYDSVVDEDLPDSFRALLDKLDDSDPPEQGDGSMQGEAAHADDTPDQPPSKGGGA